MSSIETSVAEALLPPTVAPPQIPDENATIAMDLKRPADDDANSDEVAALTTTPPPTIDNKSESIMLEVVVAVESSEAGAQVSDAVAEPCVERDFTQVRAKTQDTLDRGEHLDGLCNATRMYCTNLYVGIFNYKCTYSRHPF